MLYRIDWERFLLHGIDHFTRDNLLQIHFAVVSAGLQCGGSYGQSKVNIELAIGSAAMMPEFYPPPEVWEIWNVHEDKEMVRELYYDHLKKFENEIEQAFILNILNHVDICIICRERENDYIDILCDFLRKKYALDSIDLNKLFLEGRCGPFYLDRAEVHNKTVDLRRRVGKMMVRELERTYKGRASLLKTMKKKEKIKKLEELGIKLTESDYKDLDRLLVEAWVEDQ